MEFNNTEDLKDLAPTLAAMGKANPFSVPEHYFDELQEHLSSRIGLEQISDGGFIIPDAYFENLPSQIEGRIFLETIKEQNTSGGFEVPLGYFEGLSNTISSRVGESKSPAKVVKIRSWVQYAAAACITVAIGSGIFLNNFYSQSKVTQRAISEIPDEAIVNYLQLHSDAADTPVILEHLDGNGNNLPSISDDVSEEELQQYLNNTL